MTWLAAAAIVAGLLACFAAGVGVGISRRHARLRRVAEGVSELARGNLAHRIIMPGDDEAARVATDLNRLADAIQAEREAATSSDDVRRRLIENISHDLRTPITSIAGYVDALQRGLGDKPERYLAIIGAKTDELAQLTDDLFYAARIDAGDLELTRTRLDLAEAVRRSVLGFEPELAAKGVRVRVSIPEEPCVVEADSSAVARILSNLISNSVRHGTGMTAFGIEMDAGDTSCVVRITNDGSRLPDDAERLFGRGVAGPEGGAGLGLSIARELGERMGASVTAENAPDGGAVFALAFPCAREFSEM